MSWNQQELFLTIKLCCRLQHDPLLLQPSAMTWNQGHFFQLRAYFVVFYNNMIHYFYDCWQWHGFKETFFYFEHTLLPSTTTWSITSSDASNDIESRTPFLHRANFDVFYYKMIEYFYERQQWHGIKETFYKFEHTLLSFTTTWLNTSTTVGNDMELRRPLSTASELCCLLQQHDPILLQSSAMTMNHGYLFLLRANFVVFYNNMIEYFYKHLLLDQFFMYFFSFMSWFVVHLSFVSGLINSNLMVTTFSIMSRLLIIFSNYDYCNICLKLKPCVSLAFQFFPSHKL